MFDTTESQACEHFTKKQYICGKLYVFLAVSFDMRCKLTQVLSSPAYLSPVSPLPDVHESPNDVQRVHLSLSPSHSRVPQEVEEIRALPEVDSQVCCTQAHTYTHT